MTHRSGSGNGCTFRYGTEADSLVLATLHVASWRATYPNDLPADYLARLDPEQRAAGWRLWFRNTPMRVLMAESGTELVGFCAFGPCRDKDLDPDRVFTIYNLHVAPSLLGRGIGRELFTRARGDGIGLGFDQLSLWVVRTNLRARRFYQSCGLAPDGATQNSVLEGTTFLDEIRYRGPLLDQPQG